MSAWLKNIKDFLDDMNAPKPTGFCKWCNRPFFGMEELVLRQECVYCYEAYIRGKKEVLAQKGEMNVKR